MAPKEYHDNYSKQWHIDNREKILARKKQHYEEVGRARRELKLMYSVEEEFKRFRNMKL